MLEIKFGQFELFWFPTLHEGTRMTLASKHKHDTNKDGCTWGVGRCHPVRHMLT